MALTNAQRQANYRLRGLKARAEVERLKKEVELLTEFAMQFAKDRETLTRILSDLAK